MENTICQLDCFSCPYNDCIVDNILPGEAMKAYQRDREIKMEENLTENYHTNRYRNNRQAREKQNAYYQTELGRGKRIQNQKRYNQTEKGRARQYRYNHSEAGIMSRKRYEEKRRKKNIVQVNHPSSKSDGVSTTLF